MEAPPGFEPGVEVLQTSALPLGDGAVRKRRAAEGRRNQGRQHAERSGRWAPRSEACGAGRGAPAIDVDPREDRRGKPGRAGADNWQASFLPGSYQGTYIETLNKGLDWFARGGG